MITRMEMTSKWFMTIWVQKRMAETEGQVQKRNTVTVAKRIGTIEEAARNEDERNEVEREGDEREKGTREREGDERERRGRERDGNERD